MDRRSADAIIVSLACSSGMVITTRQLARAGLAGHLLETRQGRLLTRFSQGVYVMGDLTPEVRLRAALAAVPAGAASHRTGSGVHRLGVPVPPGVELVAPAATRRQLDGVRLRITRWLPADDLTVVDGMRVTTVARTLCDLAGVVSRSRLHHVMETVMSDGRLGTAELQACAAAYCRRGRPGSGLIRAMNHELLDDVPLAPSVLEQRTHELLRAAQLDGWTAQYRPPWYDGVRGVVDLAWPAPQVVVELDGRRWHATSQAQGDDRRRDRLAVTHGWVTLRFGWREITQRPAAVVAEIRSVLDARLASIAPASRRVRPF